MVRRAIRKAGGEGRRRRGRGNWSVKKINENFSFKKDLRFFLSIN